MALIALAITDARILGNIKNWTLKIFAFCQKTLLSKKEHGMSSVVHRNVLYIRQISGTMIKKQIMQECVITLTSPRDPHLALRVQH